MPLLSDLRAGGGGAVKGEKACWSGILKEIYRPKAKASAEGEDEDREK